MMGPKKLSEIKAELEESLAKTTDNPIEWLEERIRELEKEKKGKPGSTKVLESLLHLLEGSTRKKRPRKRKVAGSGR